MEFNEDQFILDLIKAQNFTGDPSHGGKLVKKQIIDKNGKKQTEWVRPADFNKVNKEGNNQDQENELPNTDFVDNLQNEDKAKLELIKEMIDSGDHVNAKQLADSLPDDVKHFIPKDAWKQMYEQEQIETNGVKIEGEGEKFLSSLIKPEDIKAAIRNFSQALDKYDTSNAKIANIKLSKLKPTQQGEDRINSSSIEEAKNMRELISGDLDVEDMRKEDLYPIIVDSKTNEILDGNHRYSAYEMNGYKTIPTIFVTPKTESKKDKIKKSQMNIFEKGLNQIKKFFNKAKDIISLNEDQEQDSHNKFADTIVFNSNFDILLLKRSKDCKLQPNTWWLPGGHLLESEPPIIGAYRELIEETNIQANLLDFNQVFKTIKKDNKEFNYFTTLIQDKNNPVVTLGEHQSYAWISQQSLFGELNNDFEIAFDNLQLLRDLVTKASKLMSYSVLKQAFNENKISEDQFLKLLKREMN